MMQRGITEKDRRRTASNECQALQDIVNKLKLELLQSQVERQKLQDQLHCLMYLVRRAWQGDEIASIHVANIVGMAPPNMQKSSNLNEITSTPKSRALNGWARLTIGLLNRIYHEEELELRAKQMLYLRGREELLDEELMWSDKDLMQHQTNVSTSMQMSTLELLQAKEEEKARQRQEDRDQIVRQKQELQEKFKRKIPPFSHLYSPASQSSKESVEKEAKLDVSENFLVTPVSRKDENSVSKQDGTDHESVFLTRRASSFSQDEERLPNGEKYLRQVRSQTSDGSGKSIGVQSRSRPRTSAVKSSPSRATGSAVRKIRPASAHVPQSGSFSKPPPTFDTSKTKRQLDRIEKDLKSTTKTLQDRLGISRIGFV